MPALLGQPVRLTCEFTGQPTPKATWYKDNVEIFEADLSKNGFEIKNSDFKSELVIGRMTDKMAGEYLVTVRNQFGEDLARSNVNVQGKENLVTG